MNFARERYKYCVHGFFRAFMVVQPFSQLYLTPSTMTTGRDDESMWIVWLVFVCSQAVFLLRCVAWFAVKMRD